MIEYHAFGWCKDLKRVLLNDGLSVVREEAFYGCALEEITIPATVKTLEKSVFAENKRLKSV